MNARRRLLPGLAFLAALLHLVAAAAAPGAPDQATITQLTRQSQAWDKAIVRKDRAAIADNMAEDFRDIDGYGNVADKTAFLEDILSPKLTIDPYQVEDFDVRLYGDVALLSGTTRMSGHFDGKPFSSHYRYIDIYVRRDGRWRVVSVQISKMAS
jgi:ketosteroid isomerase-like protein